jgi:queuosine precursor transporter
MRAYRYYDLIMAAFVAVLIVSNITSTKSVVVGPFTFDGGTVLFPLSYIFGDILTEVYGYSRSRRVIWTGFAATALAAGVLALIDWLPAAPGYTLGDAWHAVLGQAPRIVAASLLAYFCGEFINSFVLAKLKVATQGRWLWLRTIGSTLVGEGVDTTIFVLVAFYGAEGFSNDLVLAILISNYIFKVGFEILATPLTYQLVGFLKRAEGEDYYDVNTDFNPFRLGTPRRNEG